MRSSALKGEQRSGEPFIVSRRYEEEPRERQLGKAVLAGLAGGLIGAFAMNQFQSAWSKASKALKRDSAEESGKQAEQQSGGQKSEDSTMKAAGKIAELGGRQLSHEQKAKFGPVVHYSFGTLQGGIYGAVTELAGTRGGFAPGVTFGAALFGLADELAVPALGLSGKPTESPLSSHLYALASHLVYGISTDAVQRGLRALLG